MLLMIGVQLFDSWIYVISGIATTGSLVTVGVSVLELFALGVFLWLYGFIYKNQLLSNLYL